MATKAVHRVLYGPYMGSREGTRPGLVLEEELEARNMTQLELARKMGRPYKTVNEIVRGKKTVTAETALDLEEALGISAVFWMNLQANYALAYARGQRSSRVASHDPA